MKAPASNPLSTPSHNKGFTLIESVFTIAIIAIAMTALITMWSKSAVRSADPYWQTQSAVLGKIYLNEVSQQPFSALERFAKQNSNTRPSIAQFTAFQVQVSIENAGSEFNLSDKKIKKVSILITPPSGNQQQFVTYRGAAK